MGLVYRLPQEGYTLSWEISVGPRKRCSGARARLFHFLFFVCLFFRLGLTGSLLISPSLDRWLSHNLAFSTPLTENGV